jgi:hypothetical protein
MSRTRFFVQPARNTDGWEIRKEGASQASAIKPTAPEAWKRGVEIADNQEPSQLLKRNSRNGQFHKERTFGDDPRDIEG